LGALLCMLAACGGSNSSDSSTTSTSSSVSPTSASSSATPLVALTASSYSVAPSSTAVVAIYRSGNAAGAATVSYTTLNDSAIAGTDYTATSGSVSWSDGESGVKSISVPVTSHAAGKQFTVALTNVEGQASFGSPAAATVAVALTVGSSSSSGATTSGATTSASGSSSSSGATTSANGSLISSSATTSATKIVDSAHNVWSVSSGVVNENGTAAGVTYNVIALLYYGGTIYQENTSCQWFAWAGNAWSATSNPDPSQTPACPSKSTSTSNSTSTSTSTSNSTTFGVRACGNKLCSTKDGSPVTLIGGTMSGCESNFAPSRCDAIVAAGENYWATTWKTQHPGTNAVRLHLDTCSYLDNTACAPSSRGNIAGDVDTIIQQATAAGLYVILDEQFSAPAGQKSIGQPGFPDATESPAFWQAIANAYGHQPNVIFDIFNEPYGENVYGDWMAPNGKDVPIVANGGTYPRFVTQNNSNGNALVTVDAPYQVAGELQLLDVVRNAGATNLVLLSPTGWAGEIENWLASYNVNGNPDPLKNVGASQHAYGYNKGNAPITAVLNAGYPIVETEFEVPVGNIGTASQVLGLGVSGLIACCPHNWGGSGITLSFGAAQNQTTW